MNPGLPASSRFSFAPCEQRVRATVGSVVVADSGRAMTLNETRLEPVVYFPRDDVRMDLMHSSGHVSHCPFKCNAVYWSLSFGEHRLENLLWSYEDTVDGAHAIKGYVAFDAGRLESWFVDEVAVPFDARDSAAGYANPLMVWLLRYAPLAGSGRALTEQLALTLAGAGMRLVRLNVIIRTLHPEVIGISYFWHRGVHGVERSEVGYEMLDAPQFTESPIRLIFDGEGGVRRRLEGPDPVLDFGIVSDLHAQGMTDYVAMPLQFSDGQVHAITLSTDQPGGFTDDELGNIYEVLAVLGGLYEMHAMRHTAGTLLDTYLGHQAGSNVLAGKIRRGAGEEIKAVIVFCDLRDSTSLAASMQRPNYLGLLNQFFDCMAGAILEHDGEVLRFVGDAVLAIFPVTRGGLADTDAAREQAVKRAADAAMLGAQRLAELNQARTAKQRRNLAHGIGMHLGDVTYGNIGTAGRLEFTVIGEAANTAARVEDLCRELGETVLVSAQVARYLPGRVRDLGQHTLRGIDGSVEIYAIDAKMDDAA